SPLMTKSRAGAVGSAGRVARRESNGSFSSLLYLTGGLSVNRSHTVSRRTQVGAAVADILGAARSRTFASRAQAAWAIALVGVGAGSMAAYAQEAGSDSGANAGVLSVEEITVTGSRIRRTTDFDTANPTTVVDASYLQNLGIVNVGDAVKQLPANLSNN